MNAADVTRLVGLAAVWGASFMLMRIASPGFGGLAAGEFRVLAAGAALLVWLALRRERIDWRAHGRRYLVIGLLNAGVPFTLFAFAALVLPAGYSAILNATTPLFGAACAAAWLGDRLTPRKLVGMALGLGGVALVVGVRTTPLDAVQVVAIAACLGAAFCYGLGNTYARLHARELPPTHMAGASQWLAGLALLPLVPFAPPPRMPVIPEIAALATLAIVCTAIAQAVYYRLLANVGPAKALSVTYLVPVFGVLWARVFLGEPVTGPMLAGGALILGGIGMIAFAPARRMASAPDPSAEANRP